MPLKKSRWFVSAVCISLLAAGGAARAEEKSSIEPRAERILKAAIGNLAAAKSYMFRGEMTTEGQLPGGQRLEYAGTVQAAVRRPDHAWIRVENEDGRRSNWYDGKTFTHLDLGSQRVRDLAGAADHQRDVRQDEGEARLRAADGPPDAPDRRAKRCSRTSRAASTSGRPSCAAARAATWPSSQENIDWQLWVDNVVPVIRRIVITYKKLPGTPQFAVTFTDWDFNATLPDSVFAFDPPPGATRAEFEIVKQ